MRRLNWKKAVNKLMQLTLTILFISGLVYGNPKVIINAGIGLAITFAPAIVERKYGLTIDAFLSLWITSAVFFHSLGSFGFYGSIWWWDHLTHALSASVVAAIGYTFIRTIDLHSEKVNLPRKFMFVFILLTVIAFGVVWELFEYLLDIISDMTGLAMPLAQHGLDDTMKDMMYNILGATVTALFGHIYLSETAENFKKNKILQEAKSLITENQE